MIYNISGEQPFQVLNNSFTVSPSQSGYDLYLSADGVNYTNFASVSANTTRQFTGMNEGNYYKLVGNTSDVKVNWMKDCGGGGGDSGVSSIDGQTGALTTKTIGGQSILGSGDIEIGGGDYVVTPALSAITNPAEGMLAFVPAHQVENTYDFLKIQRRRGVEGAIAQFKRVEDDEEMAPRIDQYGRNFYNEPWSDGNGGDFAFHTNSWTHEWDGEDRELTVLWRSYIDPDDGDNSWIEVSTAGTENINVYVARAWAYTALTSETITTYYNEQFYQYKNGEWREIYIPSVFNFDRSTQAERIALFNYLTGHTDVGDRMAFFADYDSQYRLQATVQVYFNAYLREYGNVVEFSTVTRRIFGNGLQSIKVRLLSDGQYEKGLSEITDYAVSPIEFFDQNTSLVIDRGTYSGFTFDFSNVPSFTDALNWWVPGEGWLLQVREDGGALRNFRGENYEEDNQLHYVYEVDVPSHYLAYYYRRTGYTITFLFKQNGPADVSDFDYLATSVTYTAVTETISYAAKKRNNFERFDLITGDTLTCGEWLFGDGVRHMVDYVNGGDYHARLRLSYSNGTSWLDEKWYSHPIISLEPSDFTLITPCDEGKYFRYKVILDYGDIIVSFYVQTEEGYYCRFTITEGANVSSQSVNRIITLTQAEYDALTPAADAMYFITD